MSEGEAADRSWNTSDVLVIGLAILGCRGHTLGVVEAAGLLIATDARLHIWMLETGKSTKTDDELLAILDESARCRDSLRTAWERFLGHQVTEHIEQHNAKAPEERTAPGVTDALNRLTSQANAELETDLR